MSRSYKNAVPHPNRNLPPKQFKRQFNKRVRRKTKQTLDRISSVDGISLTPEELMELHDEEQT